MGQRFEAGPLPAALYVVATPIGNLKDITLRALEVLAAADVVMCEDTRHSARLLDHYGISGARQAVHEHNERAKAEGLIDKIRDGQSLALISDAGTPLLSDPGFPLVRAAREAGVPVIAIPGPSALLTALASAGLPTDSFTFCGFPPPKQKAREGFLTGLSQRTETLCFYESPRRLGDCLAAMADAFGSDRKAVVMLELTKKFERSHHARLGDLAAEFADVDTKGEAVVLVAGQAEAENDSADGWQAALESALEEKPLRGAVDDIATAFGLKRKEVYDFALALKKTKG